MPSKHGFGNSRTPMTKKVSYGSPMHYKNPVKLTAAQETLPEKLKAGIRAKEAENPVRFMGGVGEAIAGFAKSDMGKELMLHAGKSIISKRI